MFLSLYIFNFLCVSIPQFDSLVFEGLQCSYEENYTEASMSFSTLTQLEPKNPLPYLLIAGLYCLYMKDFSTDTVKEKLLAYCDTTISLAKNQIEEGDNSGLPHLWLGGGYGVRVFYNVTSEKIIAGIHDALTSINEFSKALELDSTLADAFIGVSAYDYFKYRILFFLPWLRDSKWEEEIKTACTRGKYFNTFAFAGYAGILIEEKRYDEAIEILTSLIKKFPDSRTFRWLRVKAQCGAKKWNDVQAEYKKLLELTLVGQPGNFYNESCCRIGLANVYFELEQREKCKEQCEKVLSLPKAPGIKQAKKQAKKLLEEIVDK